MGKEKRTVRQKGKSAKKAKSYETSRGLLGLILISALSVLGVGMGLRLLGDGAGMTLILAMAISGLIFLWKRSFLSLLRFRNASGDIYVVKWAGYLLAVVATIALTAYGGFVLLSPQDNPEKNINRVMPIRPESRWEDEIVVIQRELDEVKRLIGVRGDANPLYLTHQWNHREACRYLNHLESHFSVLSSQQKPHDSADTPRSATAGIGETDGRTDSERAVHRLYRYLEGFRVQGDGASTDFDFVGGRTEPWIAAKRALQGLEEHLKVLHAHFRLSVAESTVSVAGAHSLIQAGIVPPGSGRDLSRSSNSVPGEVSLSSISISATGVDEFLDAVVRRDWRIILFGILSSVIEICLYLKVRQRQRIDGYSIGKK